MKNMHKKGIRSVVIKAATMWANNYKKYQNKMSILH